MKKTPGNCFFHLDIPGYCSFFANLINNLYDECDLNYKLYDLLAIKLGKETAENLTDFIENKINQGLESKTNIFATKEGLSKVASKLEAKISESKSELLKWMFIFWASQTVGIIGFLLIYIKKWI